MMPEPPPVPQDCSICARRPPMPGRMVCAACLEKYGGVSL